VALEKEKRRRHAKQNEKLLHWPTNSVRRRMGAGGEVGRGAAGLS